MESAVSLRDLVKTFGSFRAVDGISLEIPRGIIFGLIGPNGAGKTTTIRMILDILRPDSGEVRVFGLPSGKQVKDKTGYLPEERGLYRKTKVLEMLEYQGAIRGASPAQARREAAGWLDRLDLGDWKSRKVEDLSKGMQQKVQFIGAILGKPELLILDEPFSGLDPVNQDVFKDLMLELNRGGASIIFSTHQMETAERLCKQIALINRGRVVLEGPLHQVKARFGKNSVLVEFDGDASFLQTLPGVARVDDYGGYREVRLQNGADPQAVLRAAVERVIVRRFEIVEPTLHNIFIEQVGGQTHHA
ncbi:MAG TPA: ATP-binding cassette domain-containing protein [Candidatus Polarisedimenticolia bacterium]|nr:ATP-binding cassette domain-containing protein [Candidatus Polarisedimenticolia bacterium]